MSFIADQLVVQLRKETTVLVCCWSEFHGLIQYVRVYHLLELTRIPSWAIEIKSLCPTAIPDPTASLGLLVAAFHAAGSPNYIEALTTSKNLVTDRAKPIGREFASRATYSSIRVGDAAISARHRPWLDFPCAAWLEGLL
jgi:hypothetical protein